MTTDSVEKSTQKLPLYIKLSIVLLSVFTAISLVMLFVAEFEGRATRIVSTFFIFAIFIVLTMLDTSIFKNKPSWYPPTALIANSYFMGMMLIITWITSYDYYYGLEITIFWAFIASLFVIRGALLLAELISKNKEYAPKPLQTALTLSTTALGLTAVAFTLPLLFSALEWDTPSIYWKISTAVIILTGLSISISLLLKWNYIFQNRSEINTNAQPEQVTYHSGNEAPQTSAEAWLSAKPQGGSVPVDLPPPVESKVPEDG